MNNLLARARKIRQLQNQNTFLIGLVILNKYLVFPGRLSKPFRSNPLTILNRSI